MNTEEDNSRRTKFILNTKDWLAFLAALDRPPREIERLNRLFTEPSPFEPGNSD